MPRCCAWFWNPRHDDYAAAKDTYLDCGCVTDLRRGFDGLSALVQTQLEQSPFSGHVFVFRGRHGDLIRKRVHVGWRNARAKGKKFGKLRVQIDAGRVAELRRDGLSWSQSVSNPECQQGERSAIGCHYCLRVQSEPRPGRATNHSLRTAATVLQRNSLRI